MTASMALHRPIRAGVFDDPAQAEQAIAGLRRAGFAQEQITVVCADRRVRERFRAYRHQDPAGAHTTGWTLGGGILGAAAGGLAGTAMAASGGAIGLVAAAGLGLGAGGMAGSFAGAMLTRGFEKEAANFYDQEVQRDQILVAAQAGDQSPWLLAAAEEVLAQAGAAPVPLLEG